MALEHSEKGEDYTEICWLDKKQFFPRNIIWKMLSEHEELIGWQEDSKKGFLVLEIDY